MPGNSSCLQNYKVTDILLTLTIATHQPSSFPKTKPLQCRMDIVSILEKKSQDIYMKEKSLRRQMNHQIITQNGDVMYTSKRERSSPKKSFLHKIFFKKLRAICCILYLVQLTSYVFS